MAEIKFHDLSFILKNGIEQQNKPDGILGDMLAAYRVTKHDLSSSLSAPQGFKYKPDPNQNPEITLTLAGICFSPLKILSGAADVDFETVSFRVSLVFWETISGSPDKMHIIPDDAQKAYVIGLNNNIGGTSSISGDYDPSTRPMFSPNIERNGGVILDGNYASLNFFVDAMRQIKANDTLEFDYTFLELDNYLYLARDGVFANNQSSQGIQAFRAYYTLPINVTTIQSDPKMKYVTFRTLNFMPYPTPTQNPGVLDRNDIAYHIGPTCPPWWHHGATVRQASSGSERPAFVAKQAQANDEISKEARRDDNKVDPQPPQVLNAIALYDAMDKAGYIYKDHQPLNLWQPFFIRLAVLIAFLMAIIWLLAQVLKSSGE